VARYRALLGSPRSSGRARAGSRSVLTQLARQLGRRLAAATSRSDDAQARAVGALAARAATTDVVDACEVEGAVRRHDVVVSFDSGDLHSIASAVGHRLEFDHR
jgi:NADPH:quinone reductase-like Zn-dependent oxidoreductase